MVATAHLRWLDLEGQWSETSVILKRGDLQKDLVDEQFRAAAMMTRWGQPIRREQEWDKAQFDQAHKQLMMSAFAPETSGEDDPARAALHQRMSAVRTMTALDFGLGRGLMGEHRKRQGIAFLPQPARSTAWGREPAWYRLPEVQMATGPWPRTTTPRGPNPVNERRGRWTESRSRRIGSPTGRTSLPPMADRRRTAPAPPGWPPAPWAAASRQSPN